MWEVVEGMFWGDGEYFGEGALPKYRWINIYVVKYLININGLQIKADHRNWYTKWRGLFWAPLLPYPHAPTRNTPRMSNRWWNRICTTGLRFRSLGIPFLSEFLTSSTSIRPAGSFDSLANRLWLPSWWVPGCWHWRRGRWWSGWWPWWPARSPLAPATTVFFSS